MLERIQKLIPLLPTTFQPLEVLIKLKEQPDPGEPTLLGVINNLNILVTKGRLYKSSELPMEYSKLGI